MLFSIQSQWLICVPAEETFRGETLSFPCRPSVPLWSDPLSTPSITLMFRNLFTHILMHFASGDRICALDAFIRKYTRIHVYKHRSLYVVPWMPMHSVNLSIHPQHPTQQQQLIKPTDTKEKKKCCMEKLRSKPVYFQVSQVSKDPFTTCHIPLRERGAIWDATCSSGAVTAHVLYLPHQFVVCHKVTLTPWLQKSGI